ncbi:MAG: hypothetical protein HY961_18830 [Ignavibacteriae bacterium]|nr:hypothetical protein [Ignavibacteriota bacterium]
MKGIMCIFFIVLTLSLQSGQKEKGDCLPFAKYRVIEATRFFWNAVSLLEDSTGKKFFLVYDIQPLDSATGQPLMKCPFSDFDTLTSWNSGSASRWFRMQLCPKTEQTEVARFGSYAKPSDVYFGDSLFYSVDPQRNDSSLSRRALFYTSPQVWNGLVEKYKRDE